MTSVRHLRTSILLSCASCLLVTGAILAYARWYDRVSYLRWNSTRQDELRGIGARYLVFTRMNPSIALANVDDWLAAQIVSRGDLEFVEESRDIRVTRHFQHDAATGLVLIETYQPRQEFENVLYADGHVVARRSQGE